jgi:hypothetical protein
MKIDSNDQKQKGPRDHNIVDCMFLINKSCV